MEEVIVALALGFIILVGSALGIAAFALVLRRGRKAAEQERVVSKLIETVARIERTVEGPGPQGPEEAFREAVPEEPPPRAPAPPTVKREKVEVQAGAGVRPPGVSIPLAQRREWWEAFEDRVGKRWMTWAGAMALFLAAGFFVKYAIDRKWLVPELQVALGIILGLALLVLGDISVRRTMRIFGQGLMGSGLAVLYVTLFAALHIYDLIPHGVAFAAMVVVTAAGMTLAVLHGAPTISFLALLGGLLTPVLVSTGRDARDALFSYLLLLDFGVLGVALFRRWRAVDVLAFVGTTLLFMGWYVEFYTSAAMVPTLLWLAAFYVLFLLLPFVHHLRRGTPITGERFYMALINAMLAFACAYSILRLEHRHVLGFVALGMSACYLALGAQARKRIAGDVRGLFGFVALAVVFLTMAVPLHLKVHGITLAWAVEGPVLLYLGYRYRYGPVRIAAALVLVLAVARLFQAHWPLHELPFNLLLNIHFAGAMCVPLAAAAFAIVHQWRKEEETSIDRGLKLASAIGGGFLALVILHAELAQWFNYGNHAYLGRCAVSILWAVGAVVFLSAGVRTRSLPTRLAGFPALFLTVILAGRLYGNEAPSDYLLFANMRFVAAIVTVLAIFAHGYVLRRFKERCRPREQVVAKVLYWLGGLCLLVLLSLESYNYCIETVSEWRRAQWMALMSVSIAWGVFAAVALAIGFWKRVRPLRIAALCLFGITSLKLVLVDISGVRQIYRILSFLVLGMLMIGAAYLYHRVERLLEESSGGR